MSRIGRKSEEEMMNWKSMAEGVRVMKRMASKDLETLIAVVDNNGGDGITNIAKQQLWLRANAKPVDDVEKQAACDNLMRNLYQMKRRELLAIITAMEHFDHQEVYDAINEVWTVKHKQWMIKHGEIDPNWRDE